MCTGKNNFSEFFKIKLKTLVACTLFNFSPTFFKWGGGRPSFPLFVVLILDMTLIILFVFKYLRWVLGMDIHVEVVWGCEVREREPE